MPHKYFLKSPTHSLAALRIAPKTSLPNGSLIYVTTYERLRTSQQRTIGLRMILHVLNMEGALLRRYVQNPLLFEKPY